MAGCLAGRLDTVMAADTAAGYRRMIDEGDHTPIGRNVTVRAFSGGCNMVGRF